ncbi:Murein DD-endopeptidase MepM and murein hydrolase activator NlpD, contain LysM domain [Terribacillus aidingensis]|uniref:Murein DD-endopeptidase MepM and murein hydrolase activator NlpD, contain LysM domain n=1 Tax=Terribacillus aidingensis TaxID=586416 RepID=A0A285NY33_9BACI|nr:peptidoglycan DD-metalloendopeptidase family protein [Terribacillus aidingensis]SNZ14118.1 Murein DD-endopeptidase MepM and murein hydrolase activator NlpD, contain LysM domain [Terribacillus aidingensis]
MKRKWLHIGLAAVIGTAALVLPVSGNAAYAYEDLDEKKEEVERKKEAIKEEQSKKTEKQDDLQAAAEKLRVDLKEIDSKIEKTNIKLTETESEVADLESDIQSLKTEIADLEKRIEERHSLLKDRIHSLQKNGGQVSYLDVIMESKSFSDFLNRVDAVSTIMGADQELMNAQQRDLDDVESKKTERQTKLERVEQQAAVLKETKQTLTDQQHEKDKLIEDVMKEYDVTSEELFSLTEEADLLAAQEEAIAEEAAYRDKQKAEEEARKEAERQRAEQAKQEEAARIAKAEKEEKEAAAQAESEQKAAEQETAEEKTAASAAPSASAETEPKQEVEKKSYSQPAAQPKQKASPAPAQEKHQVSKAPASSANFITPAPGYISSGFGPRAGGYHYGIDIAKRGAGVPIWAAASGKVIRAYQSSSYGNVIFVTHSINGKTYTTVYAHLTSMHVSTGQRVSQGQQIGTMGNTGMSHGQHLHFELHTGPWNASKSNAVNPRSYLN